MNYSVAIRTLGTSPETLRIELESISRQTIRPEKVIIYIAEGFNKPSFNIMNEIYVEVPKGMVSQRAVDYCEIGSDLILLLDDDVYLKEDSAEILISQLVVNKADCVAADTFRNHEMAVLTKVKAAISNFVFPHYNHKWAFRLYSNGSFSYLNRPKYDCYPSQSAAGPASIWRKKSLMQLDFGSEKWLDKLGFAYGDDELEFYKLYLNGGRLFVSYNSGVQNLDAKTASSIYQRKVNKSYVRAKSNYIRWYRMHFETKNRWIIRYYVLCLYWLKQLWSILIYFCISLSKLNFYPLTYYFKGLKDGITYVKSIEYLRIPKYKNENILLH